MSNFRKGTCRLLLNQLQFLNEQSYQHQPNISHSRHVRGLGREPLPSHVHLLFCVRGCAQGEDILPCQLYFAPIIPMEKLKIGTSDLPG